MKRELLNNTLVQAYASGDVIDKTGYLSAVLGGKVTGDVTATVAHSDDGETFEPVTDSLVFVGHTVEDGELELTDLEEDSLINIDIDLLGLKKFIKFTVTGASNLAIALSDGQYQ